MAPARFSPLISIKLWLDAADSSTITQDGSNKVSLWNDKSGNSFNLSQSTSGSQPTYDPTNSKVTFSSDSLSATAPTLSQPLTFFTVLEYSGSNTNGQYVHDSSTGRYVFGEWSSDGWGLNQGDSSLKSTTLNPITKSVFSYQFNGSSSAVFINGNQELSGTHPTDNLGGNYVLGAHNGGSYSPFQGSIYEHLIISNISSQDRQNIEGYLAHKWGLTGTLASAHPYKLGLPTSASGSPTYITDYSFGSGKAIDLSDGHVEVLTGEAEDIFDGGNSFSTSAWVKGWPEQLAGPILSKGGQFNGPDSVPSLKLWLDAKNTASMDKGTSIGASGPPSHNDNVKFWADQSGNGHHGTSNGSPYDSVGIDGLPAVNTTGGLIEISNSASTFDAWDSMSLIFVYKWAGGNWTGKTILKKGMHGKLANPEMKIITTKALDGKMGILDQME